MCAVLASAGWRRRLPARRTSVVETLNADQAAAEAANGNCRRGSRLAPSAQQVRHCRHDDVLGERMTMKFHQSICERKSRKRSIESARASVSLHLYCWPALPCARSWSQTESLFCVAGRSRCAPNGLVSGRRVEISALAFLV